VFGRHKRSIGTAARCPYDFAGLTPASSRMAIVLLKVLLTTTSFRRRFRDSVLTVLPSTIKLHLFQGLFCLAFDWDTLGNRKQLTWLISKPVQLSSVLETTTFRLLSSFCASVISCPLFDSIWEGAHQITKKIQNSIQWSTEIKITITVSLSVSLLNLPIYRFVVDSAPSATSNASCNISECLYPKRRQ